MFAHFPHIGRGVGGLLIAMAVFVAPSGALLAGSVAFEQTALVSDGTDQTAVTTDPNLKNPWGMALAGPGIFWISNQRTGTSTLYNAAGTPQPAGTPLVVNIPAARPAPAGPTGIIFNGSSDFVVTKDSKSGPALFVFVGLDGQITGWSPDVDPTNAVVGLNDSDRAIFTSLTNATNKGANTLYAANGLAGTVDTYGPDFNPLAVGGSFSDPDVPQGLVPFNVRALGGRIYVTYAIPGPEASNEPEGSGAVSVFDTDGNLLQHLIDGGPLASPWGLALAPDGFGDFGGALLVGNFNEDGHINAFDPDTGEHLGTLLQANGEPISNEELWSLQFGNGQGGADPNTLFITAGINDEEGGLFARIEPGGQVIPLPNMLLVSPFVFAIAVAARRRFARRP
ncbi:MAG: TIGR03118 family protein [Tepidisphaeraceae bacterium]